MTIQQIIEEVEQICRQHKVQSLYLFGSYAKGTATKYSDVDFYVKGVSDMAALEEAVDEILTLKKIDLFDYDHCLNPVLKEAMDQYGKKIY